MHSLWLWLYLWLLLHATWCSHLWLTAWCWLNLECMASCSFAWCQTNADSRNQLLSLQNHMSLIRVCVNVAPACVVSGNFEPLSQNIMLWLGLVVVTFGNSEENNCDHWLCHLAINPSDWRNLSPKNTKMRWFWYSWIAWRSSVIALKINLFTDRERYRKDLRPPFKKS